jgi:hypothetical protein
MNIIYFNLMSYFNYKVENPFKAIILYSENPKIYVNLSLNDGCNPPYCAEFENTNYYFVPLAQNINTDTQFNIIF